MCLPKEANSTLGLVYIHIRKLGSPRWLDLRGDTQVRVVNMCKITMTPNAILL